MEHTTTTASFFIKADGEVGLPEVALPEGEDWSLAGTAVLPRKGDEQVMLYTWVRYKPMGGRTPCPSKQCGSIAINNGVCVGCGLERPGA